MASTNTSAPEHLEISSEDVEGAIVYDLLGNKLGRIDHLVIDRISGRVLSVVISTSGFFGLGHSHARLPWSSLKYRARLNGYEAQTTPESG